MQSNATYEFVKEPLAGKRYKHIGSKRNGSKTRILILEDADDLKENDLLLTIKDATDENWDNMVYIRRTHPDRGTHKPGQYWFTIESVSSEQMGDVRVFTPEDEFIKVASYTEHPFIEVEKKEDGEV